MFDFSTPLKQFSNYLEDQGALLLVLDNNKDVRDAFLTDAFEALKEGGVPCFSFEGSDFQLSDLIQAVMDEFVIPVRSVNVEIEQQLKDQIDLLRKTQKKALLVIEETQNLFESDFLTLLKLVEYQKGQHAFKIVLSGGLSLKKRLIKAKLLSEVPVYLSLSDLENAKPKRVENKFQPEGVLSRFWNGLVTRRIRLISIILLCVVLLTLWLLEGRLPESRNKPFPDLESPVIKPEKIVDAQFRRLDQDRKEGQNKKHLLPPRIVDYSTQKKPSILPEPDFQDRSTLLPAPAFEGGENATTE